MGVKKKYSLY